MKNLTDYKDPFDAVWDFENKISEFTGAPFVVATDCCSHAIEIALRLSDVTSPVSFPARTYLSVPMTMHKLQIKYDLTGMDWYPDLEYNIQGTNIWDSARRFEPGMYRPGSLQCLSFGKTKPLEIGRGGCILTDDAEFAQKAGRMRYDGREVKVYKPWADQKVFEVGFHYFLRPEDAIVGLNLLESKTFLPQIQSYFNYPDCRELTIVDR